MVYSLLGVFGWCLKVLKLFYGAFSSALLGGMEGLNV